MVSPDSDQRAADGGWFDDESSLLGPRSWSTILAAESARCRRYGRSSTVVIVEVRGLDDLSAVWGSDVGAHTAARVGSILRAASRTSDYVARVGSGRFAVLLTETDEIAAVNYVERVRDACDETLKIAHTGARAAFGWADASKSRTLAAAEDAAVSRLRSDAPDAEDDASP